MSKNTQENHLALVALCSVIAGLLLGSIGKDDLRRLEGSFAIPAFEDFAQEGYRAERAWEGHEYDYEQEVEYEYEIEYEHEIIEEESPEESLAPYEQFVEFEYEFDASSSEPLAPELGEAPAASSSEDTVEYHFMDTEENPMTPVVPAAPEAPAMEPPMFEVTPAASSSVPTTTSLTGTHCSDREVWDKTFERCRCKEGLEHNFRTDRCECKKNQAWDGTIKSCTCPAPRVSYPSTGYCGCPSVYERYDAASNTCVCPGNQVRDAEGKCGCPAPAKLKYGTCKCPDAREILGTSGQVCACPDGATYNPETRVCECSGGRVLHEVPHRDIWQCRCPDKTKRWNAKTGACKTVHSVDVRLPMFKSTLRGQITSGDGHINCGRSGDWRDCYQLYWEGSDVTLAFHNDTDFVFGSWDEGQGLTDRGPCDCEPETESTCTIKSISRSQRCQAELGYKRKSEVEQ